jgi:HemY protein
MKKLFFSLLILLAACLLGILIANNHAYLVIIWNNWQIQMTLWLAGLLTILAFLIFYLLMRFSHRLIHLSRSIRNFRQRYRQRRLNRYLVKAEEASILGESEKSFRAYKRAAKLSDTPGIYLLKAAQAAVKINRQEANDLVKQGISSANNLFAQILATEIQLEQNNYHEADMIIETALANHPLQPKLLKLAFQANYALKNWQRCIDLLVLLKSKAVFTRAEYNNAAEKCYAPWLEKNLALNKTAVWDSLPIELQKNHSLLKIYLNYLIQHQEIAKANYLITRYLKNDYSAELVFLYANMKEVKISEQIKNLEKWLHKYGEKADIYLALAEINLRAKIWGNAIFNLEKALALEKSKRVYLHLARLAEAMHKPEKMHHYYRLAANASQ